MDKNKSRRCRRSAEEQIASLQDRALELEAKTRLVRLHSKLKSNPNILIDVEKYIDMLIARRPGGSSMLPKEEVKHQTNDEATLQIKADPMMAKPVGCGTEADGLDLESLCGPGSEDADASDLGSGVGVDQSFLADPKQWIPHCYTTIGGCSLNYLKAMLSAIEPIAFSAFSLRGLLERGKREVSKRSVTDVLEFVTGLDYDTPLTGDMKYLPKLHTMLIATAEKLGRKGRDLQLPPDWNEVGYYQLLDLGTAVPKIKHVYLRVVRDLPLDPFAGEAEEITSAKIEMNFSEQRASISTPLRMKAILCSDVFADLKHTVRGAAPKPLGKEFGDWGVGGGSGGNFRSDQVGAVSFVIR